MANFCYDEAKCEKETYTKEEIDNLINAKTNSYVIGNVIITSTNTNPSGTFGGTWELIKKEYKPTTFYSTTYDEYRKYFSSIGFMKTSNFGIIRDGNTVHFRIDFEVTTDITDNAIILGKLKLTELGIKDTLYLAHYDIPVGSDAGDCIGVIDIDAEGGIKMQDAISKYDYGSYISEGARFRLQVTFVLPQHKILESYCDKFYWKKIA